MYLSAPFHWQPDPYSEPWDVSTYGGDYSGPSTITQATLRSDNTVYARLTLDVGPEKVVQVAHKMGIKTKLEPVASVGLGSNSVGVLDIVPLGLLWGYLTHRTGSLVPAVLLHLTNFWGLQNL